MERRRFRWGWALLPFVCAGCLPGALASGEVTRTQGISLVKGWNAVFLEVDPLAPDPGRLFQDVPVDIAAAYLARTTSAQFVTDPSVDLFRELGWGVWYREDRPDAFLRTLHAIRGGQAFLLHATADHQWTVTGEVVSAAAHWKPDAYNFVGFSVADPGGPTFAQFFAGSKAHRDQPIYRLVGDSWRKVSAPQTEVMRSGEAFWIFCKGASSYPGPLGVETKLGSGLTLAGGEARLILRNHTSHPVAPLIEQVVAPGETQPLSIVIEVVGDPEKAFQKVGAAKPSGSWQQPLPPLEAGQAIAVPFVARLEEMTAYQHRSLLKVTSDLGTVHWLPVVSEREDLKE